MKIVKIFKALGDENRIRILNLLRKRELCVCEIETILDISQSNASRHLTKLKSAGVITQEKKAQWVYYKIDKKFMENNKELYEFVVENIDKCLICTKDTEKLNKYLDSRFTCKEIRENKCEVLKCLRENYNG